MFTKEQIKHWQDILQEMMADELFIEDCRNYSAQRTTARDEMTSVLDRYLTGKIDTSELRSVFQSKAANEWRSFGLSGFAGAMFLNMLVKHIPDQSELARQLRAILPVPQDVETGKRRLRAFFDFQTNLRTSGQISQPRILSPNPFFISAWWHSQDVENWPIFYPTTRRTLELEGIYQPTNDPVKNYFSFREVFLQLAKDLRLSVWSAEYLCIWYQKRYNVQPDEQKPPPVLPEEQTQEFTHRQIQWMLARLGKQLGCKVWIAANDRSKEWNSDRLGDYSIEKFPNLALTSRSQHILELIDVVWLTGNQIRAAFEVEHSTSIYSGLLRMSDLMILSPNLGFPLYIVIPKNRYREVEYELSRPTFQSLDLHERCGYIIYQDLMQGFDPMMKWASKPSDIDRLAKRVESVSIEDD